VEISQTVRVRRQQWRVAAIRSYEACQLITLAHCQATRHVLTPFDDVEPIIRSDRPLLVSPRCWRRACRALLLADSPPGGLRTAATAAIDLLPHQLEPALAVLRGTGSRLLLADDVGLGKTIQAGLIVAELFARQAAERALVLAPAGVRDQWVEELRQRFGLAPARADAAALRRLRAMLPIGVNPWQTMPLAVASIDYVKRLDVLPFVRRVRWDIVIIDEAHAAAGDSERCDAVRMLAGRASFVLLLSATPHNGDPAAFEELCQIGAVGDDRSHRSERLVVFRRRRGDVRGDRSRRTRVLQVRSSVAERHMYDALGRYRTAVAAEHGERALALAVLEKRALSSPWSLAESVNRRLAALSEREFAPSLQLTLPLSDPDGELSDADAPPLWPADLALSDHREDRRLLTAVVAAARTAALHDDSKLRRLRRLLHRVRESVLIFTEYRDTAMHLAAVLGCPTLLLHGSMSRIDRAAVIETFSQEPRTILIATDAAGQGLNLHAMCRLVINVELPWNPMRLEQRIGRVDRIGQTRVVHAVHLVAADTPEAELLSRLKGRVARARAAINAPDPVGGVGNLKTDSSDSWNFAEQREVAAVETARLAALRSVRRTVVVAEDDLGRPLLMLARRRRRLRALLNGRTLLLCRLDWEDREGRVVESRIVPLLAKGGCQPAALRIPAVIVDRWRRDVDAVRGSFHMMRLERARAIAREIATAPLSLFQPALFDARAERAQRRAAEEQSADAREADALTAAIERQALAGSPTARLQLIVR
jgi:superfamily II DNA or RNA helicase